MLVVIDDDYAMAHPRHGRSLPHNGDKYAKRGLAGYAVSAAASSEPAPAASKRSASSRPAADGSSKAASSRSRIQRDPSGNPT